MALLRQQCDPGAVPVSLLPARAAAQEPSDTFHQLELWCTRGLKSRTLLAHPGSPNPYSEEGDKRSNDDEPSLVSQSNGHVSLNQPRSHISISAGSAAHRAGDITPKSAGAGAGRSQRRAIKSNFLHFFSCVSYLS